MLNNKDENIHLYITRLLKNADIEDTFKLFPIFEGGNNRAWLLKTKEKDFFLKNYFSSKFDSRDRFGTELSFSIFAWENNIREIPEPIAADRANLLSIANFIPGRRPMKEEINISFFEQALEFLKKLNLNKRTIRGQSLPYASDSCFSIADHFESLEKKIGRLMLINTMDDIDAAAKAFIKNELTENWNSLKSKIQNELSKNRFDFNNKIHWDEMILSPSDFGYHNTILSKNGKLFFVDFEYAGWDDPAKLICDFFNQPELPVSIDYFDWFIETMIKALGEKQYGNGVLLRRARLLFPLYKLKWCCILLNDFITVDRERKNFASFSEDKRKVQLDKAINHLRK